MLRIHSRPGFPRRLALRGVALMTAALAIAFAGQCAKAEDFAIRDGDTVVFLGDSITASRTYGKIIENYTLLRYPERRVRFFNAGIGGDTAAGGLARLERDVFARGATVLTVAYGINDIGWGVYADDAHRQKFIQSIGEIVTRCRERGVRVYICSAAITGSDPMKSENDYLQTMCDEGMALARKNGGQSIDVQRTMREIQKRVWKSNESIADPTKKESLHTSDGVHLNEIGQTAMAYAILKGLGAPADVSSASVDAKSRTVLESRGCQISDVSGPTERLEFTRLDEGLPLNGETFFGLHFRFIPIHEELNRYLVQVKSLPQGDYDLVVDGRKVSTYSANQFEQGINISSATADPWQPGGPWDAQANILHTLTESRSKLESSAGLATNHLPGQTLTRDFLANVTNTNTKMEEMQRQIAKPRPYRFVIQKSNTVAAATPTNK